MAYLIHPYMLWLLPVTLVTFMLTPLSNVVPLTGQIALLVAQAVTFLFSMLFACGAIKTVWDDMTDRFGIMAGLFWGLLVAVVPPMWLVWYWIWPYQEDMAREGKQRRERGAGGSWDLEDPDQQKWGRKHYPKALDSMAPTGRSMTVHLAEPPPRRTPDPLADASPRPPASPTTPPRRGQQEYSELPWENIGR